MYPEDKLAEVIGVKREDLIPFREGRTVKKAPGDMILWTVEGVEALLIDLGIPTDKTPPALLADLLKQADEKFIRERDLIVHAVPGNPDNTRVILATDAGVVVRVLIRQGTGRDYKRGMTIHAKEKTIGLWKVDLAKTRFPYRDRRRK